MPVLFLGNNGPLPTFKHQRTAGLRGSKLSLYEGIIRVTCIAWGPGLVPAGVTNENRVFAAVDLFPTLATLCRCALPKGCKSDGEDLGAALLDKMPKRKKPLFWEYKRNDKASPTRTGRTAVRTWPSGMVAGSRW